MYSLGAVGSTCAYAGSMINVGIQLWARTGNPEQGTILSFLKFNLNFPSKLCMKQGFSFRPLQIDLHEHEVKFDSSSIPFSFLGVDG